MARTNFITDDPSLWFLSESWSSKGTASLGKDDVNAVPVTPWYASSSYWCSDDANAISGALKDLRTSAIDYRVLSQSVSGFTTSTFAGLSSTVHSVDVHVSGVDAHVSGVDPILSGVSASLSSTAAEVVVISTQLSQTIVDEQAVSGSLVSVSSSLSSYIAYTSASLALIPPLSASVTTVSNSLNAVSAEVTALSQTVFALNHPAGTGTYVYYVRTTGSDETGNGTAGLPWRTLQHALLALPVEAGYNRYYIDISGITELFPSPYSIPRCRGAAPQEPTAGTADEPTGFVRAAMVKQPVNIFATMAVLTASVTATASASISGSPGVPGTGRSSFMRYFFSGNLWPAAGNVADSVTGSLVGAFIHASGVLEPPYPVAFNGFVSASNLSYIDVPTDVDIGAANAPLTLFTYGAHIYASGTVPAALNTDEGNSVLVVNTPTRLQFAGVRFSAAERTSVAAIRFTDVVWFTNCGFDTADPAQSGTANYGFDKFWNGQGRIHNARSHVVIHRSHVNGVRTSGFGYTDIYESVARARDVDVMGPSGSYDNTQLGGPGLYDIEDVVFPGGCWHSASMLTIADDNLEGNLHGSAIKLRDCCHYDYSRQAELTGTATGSGSILVVSAIPAGSLVDIKTSDLDSFNVAIGRGAKVNIQDCTDNLTTMTPTVLGGANLKPGSELSFYAFSGTLMAASWSLGSGGSALTGTLTGTQDDTVTDNLRRTIWVTTAS